MTADAASKGAVDNIIPKQRAGGHRQPAAGGSGVQIAVRHSYTDIPAPVGKQLYAFAHLLHQPFFTVVRTPDLCAGIQLAPFDFQQRFHIQN